MSSLLLFLQNFLKSKGHFVFLSFLLAKICGFLSSVLIIRLLTKEEFGILNIVIPLTVIFIPISGLGAPQGLLRYGMLQDSEREKQNLSAWLFRFGCWSELGIILLFLLLSVFYIQTYEGILFIFVAGAVRIMGFFLLSHIQTYYRISARNDVFSLINNTINIGGLVLMLIFTFFFGFYGYLFTFAIVPYFSIIWLRKEIWQGTKDVPAEASRIRSYGFYTALTAVLSEALFALDLLLLSFWMNETAVADYKVAMLLPANITFLAISFMQTDFPVISKNYRNRSYLVNYIKNYYKIFLPLCLLILIFFYFSGSFIMHLFFGEKYQGNSGIMMILMTGFTLGMLSFNLFGNLLPAVGKVKINTWCSVIALFILPAVAYVLVPFLGIAGMACAMSITLLTIGLFYAFFFYRYLNTLKL